MSFRVQNPLVQADHIRRRVQQVEVLEGLGKPEGLHLILLVGVGPPHVVDRAVASLSLRVPNDGLKHLPALFLPRLIASDTIHVPYRLNGLRSTPGTLLVKIFVWNRIARLY